MTVKSGASRVGHLYVIWPLKRGGGLQYEHKMEFLSQANLDVSLPSPRPHYSARPKRFGSRGPIENVSENVSFPTVRLGYVTKMN